MLVGSQFHNGSITTWELITVIIMAETVSIPQWFDYNVGGLLNGNRLCGVSIPQWFDYN